LRVNKRFCTITACALLSAAGATGAAGQPAHGSAKLTEQQVMDLSPLAQSKYLAPLRADAEALGTVGRGAGAGVYGNIILDIPNYQVDLLVTDPGKAASFIAAARRVDKSIDTGLIKVDKARYTNQTLDVARDRLFAASNAKTLGYTIQSIAVDPQSDNLQVGVADPTTAGRLSVKGVRRLAAANPVGIPLVFVKGTTVTNSSWGDVKWHDSAPYISGDVIMGNDPTDAGGVDYCTTGIPAIDPQGVDQLLTAGHCFADGANVNLGGGKTGAYDGTLGAPMWLAANFQAYVTGHSQEWDVSDITGISDNADESDTSTWIPLTSDAYSYDGDLVCQDGARSFFSGHPTPCNIKVVNQNLEWTLSDWSGSHQVKGVEGYNSTWTCIEGDSGGVVFTITGTNSRQARGMVSATVNSSDLKNGSSQDMLWVEAPDILNHYGYKLNPKT
jgi:hypothetical protein